MINTYFGLPSHTQGVICCYKVNQNTVFTSVQRSNFRCSNHLCL